MDFDLNDDQRLLRDSADRLLDDRYGDFARRQAWRREPRGWHAANWQAMADVGLLGLPFAEADGGFGGGPVEVMLVMEAFGRALALEPYLATVILGGGAVRLAGDAAQRAAVLPGVIAGATTLAFAHQERQARYDLFDVATTATAGPDGFVLDGGKSVVLHGESADLLVVSARTAGGRRERDGITLFLLDAASPGVTRRGSATQDGLRVAEITLAGVRVGAQAMLGAVHGALPVIEQVVDLASAALCAEAVGAMQALHAMTVDYLKTRQQFGVAIGSFQSLQHRAVDMMIALEQARSMAMYAAMMVEAPDPAVRRVAIAAARVQVGQSARFVGQQAIQLHGGIGMTEDYRAGHYFKRLTMIENCFGDTDHHLRIVADAGGLDAAA
jgi:pimeloyl-CoA dehydrogenase small subunit